MWYRVWAQYGRADVTRDRCLQSRGSGASLLEFRRGLLCAWDPKSCWKPVELLLLNAEAVLSSGI